MHKGNRAPSTYSLDVSSRGESYYGTESSRGDDARASLSEVSKRQPRWLKITIAAVVVVVLALVAFGTYLLLAKRQAEQTTPATTSSETTQSTVVTGDNSANKDSPKVMTTNNPISVESSSANREIDPSPTETVVKLPQAAKKPPSTGTNKNPTITQNISPTAANKRPATTRPTPTTKKRQPAVPSKNPTNAIPVKEPNPFDDPSAYFSVTTSTGFRGYVYSTKQVTYQEMLQLAKSAKALPIFTIYGQEGTDFLPKLYRAIGSNSERIYNKDGVAMFWTGAYYDLSKENGKDFIIFPDDRTAYASYLDGGDSLYLAERHIWCKNETKEIRTKQLDDSYAKMTKKQGSKVHSLMHIMMRIDKHTQRICLKLYGDDDIGRKEARLTAYAAGQYQPVSKEECVNDVNKKCYGTPQKQGSVIVDRLGTFDEAKRLCGTTLNNQKYGLSGINQANEKFLSETANVINNMKTKNAIGVWVGGYFDVSSNNIYNIHWIGGAVSDFRKFNKNVWCGGHDIVKKQLEVAAKLRSRPGAPLQSRIPIVRHKTLTHHTAGPGCLLAYVYDFYWPGVSVFAPLCVPTKP